MVARRSTCMSAGIPRTSGTQAHSKLIKLKNDILAYESIEVDVDVDTTLSGNIAAF